MKKIIETLVTVVIIAGILFAGYCVVDKMVDERISEVDSAKINTVCYFEGENVKETKIANNKWAVTTLDNNFIMTVDDEYMYNVVTKGLYNLFKD